MRSILRKNDKRRSEVGEVHRGVRGLLEFVIGPIFLTAQLEYLKCGATQRADDSVNQ